MNGLMYVVIVILSFFFGTLVQKIYTDEMLMRTLNKMADEERKREEFEEMIDKALIKLSKGGAEK